MGAHSIAFDCQIAQKLLGLVSRFEGEAVRVGKVEIRRVGKESKINLIVLAKYRFS
jgi:hypothetical protein